MNKISLKSEYDASSYNDVCKENQCIIYIGMMMSKNQSDASKRTSVHNLHGNILMHMWQIDVELNLISLLRQE